VVNVNVQPFEIEVRTRHGDMVRADVHLPRDAVGKMPVLLGASPYQKALGHLPVVPLVFPFIEYGPMQLYLDHGYAYVVMDRLKVRFFVQGEGVVREAADWPPPDVSITEFFLCGEKCGAVNSLNDGSLAEAAKADGGATSWSYPDSHWMAGVTVFNKDGVPDHFARVVAYTTPPFERDREFTGQGVFHLFVSSDQTDADIVVKLSLLLKGGESPPFMKISKGWLRASHRAEDQALTTEMRPFHLHQKAEPIEPGQIYELRVELLPMPVLVRRGERLRLEISNWESAITEAPMTHWYGQKAGTDTYHHTSAHPSRLRLHERPRTPTMGNGQH
jgi:uncharacterized protein